MDSLDLMQPRRNNRFSDDIEPTFSPASHKYLACMVPNKKYNHKITSSAQIKSDMAMYRDVKANF